MTRKAEPAGKKYYSISEVSERLGVNPSLLRHWEKHFPGITPRKNKKGNRYYQEGDIQYLLQIQYLVKDKKLTLEGARQVLRDKQKEADKEYHLVHTLRSIRSLLVDLKSDLKRNSGN